jgi:AcrR family transcriptional regulator
MRDIPKTVQRSRPGSDKPVKERIAEKARVVFTQFGLAGEVQMIAKLADTNIPTVLKYYRNKERLAYDFIKGLMKEIDEAWEETERDHPNDPEAQLRERIFMAQITSDIRDQSPHVQLARASVDLLTPWKHAHLTEIEAFWRAEHRKIKRLCEAAKFRDPSGLADKLVMLMHGAHNERNCYGDKGPSKKLSEAGDDLMIAHGAEPKAPFEFDDD